ncbi:MAG: N-acetyltransferase [Chloroflexi bacterium]|nr:N-acetyltransferase [Chloroflexota bacterium]
MDIVIREEEKQDIEAVYAVNESAFGRADEAELVNRLREVGVELISLVALMEGQIVGHALFSPMTLRSESETWPTVGLGPIGVLSIYQKQSIGGKLISAGMTACHAAGYEELFVLGHPSYYPRFGFRVTRPYHIRCAYDVPEDVFMVVELRPGALNGKSGIAHYHPAFDGV